MRSPRSAREHLVRGFRLIAHCRACRHNADLPLERIEARFGDADLLRPDSPLRQAVPCSRCGARDISLSSTSTERTYGPRPLRPEPPATTDPPVDPVIEAARLRGRFP